MALRGGSQLMLKADHPAAHPDHPAMSDAPSSIRPTVLDETQQSQPIQPINVAQEPVVAETPSEQCQETECDDDDDFDLDKAEQELTCARAELVSITADVAAERAARMEIAQQVWEEGRMKRAAAHELIQQITKAPAELDVELGVLQERLAESSSEVMAMRIECEAAETVVAELEMQFEQVRRYCNPAQ